jgi:hypothetical protein
MQVFRGVPERATTPTVLTIGNFDGVHLGHRALLQELKAKARELAQCDQRRAVHEIGKREEAEAALALAQAGKAGAEQREAAALEYGRELAASEAELRGQVANLETRLAWAENARHVLERRFYEFALSKGATLEELREQFPGHRIDHRGTVA